MQRTATEVADTELPRTIVPPESEYSNARQVYNEMIQPQLADMIGYDHGVDGSMQALLYMDELSRNAANGSPAMPQYTQEPSVNQISGGIPDPASNFLNYSRPFGGEAVSGAAYSQSALMDGNPIGYPPRMAANKLGTHAHYSLEEAPPMGSREMAELMGSPSWLLPAEAEIIGGTPQATQRRGKAIRKSLWQPNNEQMRLLDEHYNSSSPTPLNKLLKTLQQEGEVTAEQLSSWLRKRPHKLGFATGAKPDLAASTPLTWKEKPHRATKQPPIYPNAPDKRPREEKLEEVCAQFSSILDSVINEMSSVLTGIDVREIRRLCRTIKNARCVICHGVGIEGLVMQAFARALNEAGIEAYYLTDVSVPQVAEDDVFIVSAGPSFYTAVSALALEAKRLGTPVIAFTAHPAADMLFAKDLIRIPSQTLTPSMPILSKKLMAIKDTVSFLPDGDESVLNLGTSYDLALRLTLEAVIAMLTSQQRESQHEPF